VNKIFLNLTVLPYRSLSKKGFRNLMFCVSFIFFSIGVYFWYLGAWPVFGFIGLDVVLLYYAFRINYRSGEIFETLKMEKEFLLVTRNFPSGKKQSWSLEPYWASVQLITPNRNEQSLIIKSKDKVVLIGSFLNNNDKEKLFKKIQDAFNSFKNQTREIT